MMLDHFISELWEETFDLRPPGRHIFIGETPGTRAEASTSTK